MSNPNLNREKQGLNAAEREFENTIRPGQIKEFAGQPQLIENLTIFIRAAKIREKRWIMCCFMALPAWVKLPCRALWPMSWE
ncbi:hypothetical protein LWM68_40320 [Niabella sp. W65]|nr:hypothetical protein [Niabella sp. W65]ULT44034.1 hypothetical protein KRR40_12020 [Niabella sp. I65]